MEQFKPGIYIARDSKKVKYGGEDEGSWLSKYSFVEPEDFEKVASKLKSGKTGDRPIYTKLKTYHKDIWNSIQKNLGIKEEDFFANDSRLEIQEEVVIEQGDKKIILEKGDMIRVIEGVSKHISPIRSVDLRTGKNSLINNIYDVWNNANMHCEFWKEWIKGTIKIIFGSGLKPHDQIGSVIYFVHDQTEEFLFKASLIDSCSLDDLQSRISEYGGRLDGYVFRYVFK